jgi:signal transduction histidine kinase
VERQTLVGFGAAAALLLLVSVTAVLAVRSFGQSAWWVTHSYEVIGELDGLSAALSAGESARRGFLATGESSYLEERDAAVSRMQSHLQSVKLLMVDNVNQQRRLRDLEALLQRRAVQAEDLIITAQTDGLEAARRGLAVQNLSLATADAGVKIDELESVERNLLVARNSADGRSDQALTGAFGALLLTVAAVLYWLCMRIRREMLARAQQAAELRRAYTGLEAANRELESFSYSVSHDLRSPLRAIDGYSQMLEEDFGPQLDETGRRYIRTVRNGSQRMAALIDDLLTFSRLSRQSLNRQLVDMTALARRAAAEVLEAQVWINLIGNAVKYSSKSVAPAIRVRAAREQRLIRYEVQDNGVGFDMKYADKLFGVFQRLHAEEDFPGTGVGLALTMRIVSKHGGRLWAEAALGKGATFHFSLPSQEGSR